MTTKREKKKDERPKLKKEKLKDLDTEKQGEDVKGGAIRCTDVRTGCGGAI